MNQADIVVLSLARMALEDFRQILILCSKRETTGGMKILRGMFERVATAGYIHKYPEAAEDFINFFPIARYKEAVTVREFLSDEAFNEIEAERDKVLPRYMIEYCSICKKTRPNHTWTKVDVPAMAQKVGLKPPMFGGYYFPMQEIHATVASIMRRVEFNEADQRYGYYETASLNEAKMVLATAHYLALGAIETLKNRFELDSIQNQYSQCLQDYNQIWGQSPMEGNQ